MYRTWAINIPVLHKRSHNNALTIVTESVTFNQLLSQPSFQGLSPSVSGHGNLKDNGDEVATL